jgi:hypothetical protein
MPTLADAQTVVVSPNWVRVSAWVSVAKLLSVCVDTPPLVHDPVSVIAVRLPSSADMEILVSAVVPGTILVS